MSDLSAKVADLVQRHVNALVEERAREIESFILGMARATGCSPLDVELVEKRDGLMTTWRLQRRASPTSGANDA